MARTVPHRRPYRGASTPQDRLRHSRWQTRRLRCPGPALRPQTLLRPFPASGRPRLEDRRRRGGYDAWTKRGRRAVRTLAAIRCGEDPPRDPAETLFEAVAETVFERYRTALEAGNARCQPVLPEKPDPAPLPGTASRRHRPAGCPGLVRLAARDAGRRRPVHAGALRHHEGGGSHGSSTGGLQPLPRHPALPPQGPRALSVGRGDAPPIGKTVGTCGRLPLSRSPWSASSC